MAVTDIVNALNIEYHAAFVPQSLSRNSGNKFPSLNWRVTIKRNGIVISTDYMQGIARMPYYSFGKRTKDVAERETMAAEQGRYSKPNNYFSVPLPAPALVDVMHSLMMDSEVLAYSCYEDWASDFGYDTDSRKGEAVYHACRAIAIPFSKMFTRQELDDFRIAFQDY